MTQIASVNNTVTPFSYDRPVSIGLHFDMPMDVYRKIDAINKSSLDKLHVSPAHLMADRANPMQPTSHMEFGTAVHDAWLLPDYYTANYVVAPKFDKRTKHGQVGHAAFTAANAGKTLLDADQVQAINGMVDALNGHGLASSLFSGGKPEVSMVWKDRQTGLLCKGRMDYYRERDGIVVDLKTTEDAGPKFSRSAWDRRYLVQAAFYLDGLIALDLPACDFVFVAIEKKPPYGISCYRITERSLAHARKEYRRDLELYAQCKATNQWPGYPEQLLDLDAPAWELKKADE